MGPAAYYASYSRCDSYDDAAELEAGTMAALRDDPRGDVEKLDRVGQEMLARAMRTPGEHMHEAGKRGVKS